MPDDIPPQLFAERGPQATAELVAAGQEAFHDNGCTACHSVDGTESVGPPLAGIFGQAVQLDDGQIVKRDEVYLYRAITAPQAQTVADYPPQLMPPYEHLDRPTLIAVVEYLASLTPAEPAGTRGTRSSAAVRQRPLEVAR